MSRPSLLYPREYKLGQAIAAVWERANPEAARQWSSAHYAEKHRIARSADQAARKAHAARKRGAPPGTGITASEMRRVLAESLGLCAYCGERRPLTLDHVDPLALGGHHDVGNAAMACRSCNSSKNDTPLLIWLASRGPIRKNLPNAA